MILKKIQPQYNFIHFLMM